MLSVAPAMAQRLESAGFERTVWQGQEVYAEPGEWILSVRGVKGTASRQLAEARTRLARVGVAVGTDSHLGRDGLFKVTVPTGLDEGVLHQAFRRVRGFEFAEPNAAIWVQAEAVDDPLYVHQYALNNTGWGLADADIDAPEAWELAPGGEEVVVGVIDTGVEYTHPDLAASMWVNPFEVPGDRVDNDRNGFVDDVYGADFAHNDADPMDDHGHGTHVAGIIAAASNNGVGVSGVAPNARVMALRFLSADGFGSVDGAVRALRYAMDMKAKGVNVRVTNNSWGSAEFSVALDRAIRESGDAGMLFVAAAGNGGSDDVGDDNDFEPFYPASYDAPSVISVAGTDNRDALLGLSNFGHASVDLAAPAGLVYSTYKNNTYGYMTGTSMASPHVAGVAALAWGQYPAATWQQVHAAVIGGVDDIAAMAGKTVTGGRLNAAGALRRMALGPAVVGRHVFYNGSGFDARSADHVPADGAAVATDKVALLPGGTAAFANYTSYSKGINGVMVDVRNPPGALAAGDFRFETRDRSGHWAPAPAASVTTRVGTGTDHSTRVTMTWPDGAIRDTWLRVTLLPNTRNGLAQPDVFYFGNAVAETGNSPLDAAVNVVDVAATRAAQSSAVVAVDSRYDFNRDRAVNVLDAALVRSRVGTAALPLITADPLVPMSAAGATATVAAPQLAGTFSTTRIRPATMPVQSVGALVGLA